LSEIAWKPAHRQEIESGIVDDARRGVHAGDELLGEVEEEGEVAEGAASPPPSSVKGELIRGLREYSWESGGRGAEEEREPAERGARVGYGRATAAIGWGGATERMLRPGTAGAV